jgi:hypothetical protein
VEIAGTEAAAIAAIVVRRGSVSAAMIARAAMTVIAALARIALASTSPATAAAMTVTAASKRVGRAQVRWPGLVAGSGL